MKSDPELNNFIMKLESSIKNENLMEVIKENKEEWESFLKVLCKINNKSYYKEIEKILNDCGYTNINENKIRTYFQRV